MSKTGILKNIIFRSLQVGCILLCTVACNEDENEYIFPPIISELVEVHTNNQGVCSYLLTDQGERLTIGNRITTTDSLTKDSAYRCSCRYALNPDNPNEALIYSLQQIPSSHPIAAHSIPEIKSDPLSLQSIWIGGSYLNLALQVKCQKENHSYKFIEDSLKVFTQGGKTLHLRLYHDAGKDVEAYTQIVYLSVPLYHYLPTLQKGDTIAFSVNTSEKGWQTWKKLLP